MDPSPTQYAAGQAETVSSSNNRNPRYRGGRERKERRIADTQMAAAASPPAGATPSLAPAGTLAFHSLSLDPSRHDQTSLPTRPAPGPSNAQPNSTPRRPYPAGHAGLPPPPDHGETTPIPSSPRRGSRIPGDASFSEQLPRSMPSVPATLTDSEDRGRLLSLEMRALAESCRPSAQVLRQRQSLIKRVATVINSTCPSHFPFEVVPFGSTVNGLDSSQSDLDLVVIDPARPDGLVQAHEVDQLPRVYQIRWLAKVLRRAGFVNVVAIVHASVPIVKFSDGSIDADISVGESFGVRNTQLICSYMDTSPLLRPLCIAIKSWAKARRLCDPAGKNAAPSFSSYTLILMTIAYLQVTGHLPNLQDPNLIRTTGTRRTLLWSKPRISPPSGRSRPSRPPIAYDTTFCAHAPPSWQPPAGTNLAAVFEGFFAYYRDLDFVNMVVSIRSGGPQHRSTFAVEGGADSPDSTTDAKRTWQDDKICTQDPFIVTRNTSLAIKSAEIVTRIQRELRRACTILERGGGLEELCRQDTDETNDAVQRFGRGRGPRGPQDANWRRGQSQHPPVNPGQQAAPLQMHVPA